MSTEADDGGIPTTLREQLIKFAEISDQLDNEAIPHGAYPTTAARSQPAPQVSATRRPPQEPE